MTMNLDHEELHRLLATLAESDIQEFRLEGEDFCLEVKRNFATSLESIASNNSLESSFFSRITPGCSNSGISIVVPSSLNKLIMFENLFFFF